jgi:DNA-binding transcriptional MerR regulator
MKDNRLFSLTDFAKFSRTTRDALCHYDRIGLLSPISRGDNGYRYYSGGQLAVVNVIRTLQELGMSLSEIKILIDRRTPEHTNTMLLNQIDKIDKKIDNWITARKLLATLQKSIFSVLNTDENAITVQTLPEKAIILGDLNDYSDDKNAYDALLNFYNTLNDRYLNLDLNCPVWAVFSEERIKNGDWVLPDYYYFYNPNGREKRPAALYAIGYTRSSYGQGGELYKRLIDYINENGFEICGNAYEEYSLNEICISDDENYLMRVMITVRRKNAFESKFP